MELTNKEWKEFLIDDLFRIKIGKNIDGNKINKQSGKSAYITRKENNNGLDGFIDFDKSLLNKDYPVITIGNETAEPFVQEFPFFTGTKVNILIPKISLNSKVLFFIATSLKAHKNKYSYSFTINSTRLRKQKILLPVTSKGEPDYAFMESYMKQKEKELLEKYQNHILLKINKKMGGGGINLNSKVEWKEFFIEDIFNIKSGKRLTKAEMISGEIPFIGATDSNNGITEFIANKNSSLDKNVLGVNYNGSVVYNFYHSYEAIFSDDVKRLSFKEFEGNKHSFLFVKTLIMQQKSKYEYGYKFNGERMKRQKILLPVTSKGKPNYAFMENYIKLLEYEKLKLYLDYKKLNTSNWQKAHH